MLGVISSSGSSSAVVLKLFGLVVFICDPSASVVYDDFFLVVMFVTVAK